MSIYKYKARREAIMTVVIGYRDNNNALIFTDSMRSSMAHMPVDTVNKTIKLDNFSFGCAGNTLGIDVARKIALEDTSIAFDNFLNKVKAELLTIEGNTSFEMLVISKESMVKLTFANMKSTDSKERIDNLHVKAEEITDTIAAIGSGSQVALAVADVLLTNTDLESVWDIANVLKTAVTKASEYATGCGGNVNLVVVKGHTEKGNVYNLQDSLNM